MKLKKLMKKFSNAMDAAGGVKHLSVMIYAVMLYAKTVYFWKFIKIDELLVMSE